jgi:hypothetical protein
MSFARFSERADALQTGKNMHGAFGLTMAPRRMIADGSADRVENLSPAAN